MDDRELVRRCLEGQSGDFRPIVERYSAPLLAAAITILGNRQDAEDLCQETFVQAYFHLSRFDTTRNLKVWLYTILYRRCLNVLKRKRRLAAVLNRIKFEPGAWISPANPGPGASIGLPPALYRRLSARERTVLSLWANDGYTAAEIAAIIGRAPSTARCILFTVRKKIRALLESEKEHDRLSME